MQQRIAAVVLAAGMSRRMGRPKALLPLGDSAMIVRVLDPLVNNGSIDPVVVVTGHQAEQVRQATDGLKVEFIQNPDYEAGGMLSSVKAGCRAIQGRCDWFFLVLGDQPLVQASTYLALLDTKDTERPLEASASMIQPTFQSRRGHPILLAASCIPDILALPGDATLKTFTQRIEPRPIEVDDPGVVSDIDTPEDYDRALIEFQAHRSEPCKQKV